MGKQVRVNLTIDEDVVNEAKEIGLNLSKIAENALKEAVLALKRSKIYSTEQKTETNGGNLHGSKPASSDLPQLPFSAFSPASTIYAQNLDRIQTF